MRWLAVLLLAGATLIGCAQEEAPSSTASDDLVDVPDVRRMPLGDGAAALQALGLCVLVEQGNGSGTEQVVVAQRPAPGVATAEGTLVTIVIDTPDDVFSTMEDIGAKNEALGCLHGSGVGGEGMTAT